MMMAVVFWLRAWIAPLWAAIASTAQWQGPPEKATVAHRQVAFSLEWLEAFMAGRKGNLMRIIPVHTAPSEGVVRILCDASPWGIGAVLIIDDLPVQRMEDTFTEMDHLVMGTVEGSPDGQAAFEALAILVAARIWLPMWADRPMSVILQSDSIAALGSTAKAGSSVPHLNAVMRELSLDLAEAAYSVSFFGHVPGDLNHWADALSRRTDPNAPKEVLEELRHIPKAVLPARDKSWWRAAGPPTSST